MRMLRWLVACPLLAMPAMAQTVPAPEVTMRLSSDRILLGEPVWVLVTARNTSAVIVRWNPGDYGFTPEEQPDQVRRSAIFSIGYLGGDSAVATLLEVAHRGGMIDQADAMTALGSTQSLLGVRALIDLMTAPDIINPTDPEWPLFVLTHPA